MCPHEIPKRCFGCAGRCEARERELAAERERQLQLKREKSMEREGSDHGVRRDRDGAMDYGLWEASF